MSEVSSQALTARGIGFKDYKPPVVDSPNIKTIMAYDLGSQAHGGHWEVYFGADPAITEIMEETIEDWWGKDLSFFLKIIVIEITSVSGTNIYKNAWEGLGIELAAWDELGINFDIVYSRTVGQGQFPAISTQDSTSKTIRFSFLLDNYKIEKDQFIQVAIDNYAGDTLNSPVIYIAGVVQQAD